MQSEPELQSMAATQKRKKCTDGAALRHPPDAAVSGTTADALGRQGRDDPGSACVTGCTRAQHACTWWHAFGACAADRQPAKHHRLQAAAASLLLISTPAPDAPIASKRAAAMGASGSVWQQHDTGGGLMRAQSAALPHGMPHAQQCSLLCTHHRLWLVARVSRVRLASSCGDDVGDAWEHGGGRGCSMHARKSR